MSIRFFSENQYKTQNKIKIHTLTSLNRVISINCLGLPVLLLISSLSLKILNA